MTGTSAIGRRFRKLSTATAVLAAGAMLAACGGESATTPGATGEKSADNPFGVAKDSTVEAVLFDGGLGTE